MTRNPEPRVGGAHHWLSTMLPTAVVQGGRSAWKGMFMRLVWYNVHQFIGVYLGPFFVAFPNLRHALENNVAIKTQARSCTILPNFIGCAAHFLLFICALSD